MTMPLSAIAKQINEDHAEMEPKDETKIAILEERFRSLQAAFDALQRRYEERHDELLRRMAEKDIKVATLETRIAGYCATILVLWAIVTAILQFVHK